MQFDHGLTRIEQGRFRFRIERGPGRGRRLSDKHRNRTPQEIDPHALRLAPLDHDADRDAVQGLSISIDCLPMPDRQARHKILRLQPQHLVSRHRRQQIDRLASYLFDHIRRIAERQPKETDQPRSASRRRDRSPFQIASPMRVASESSPTYQDNGALRSSLKGSIGDIDRKQMREPARDDVAERGQSRAVRLSDRAPYRSGRCVPNSCLRCYR